MQRLQVKMFLLAGLIGANFPIGVGVAPTGRCRAGC
jgi:hypothetical protein